LRETTNPRPSTYPPLMVKGPPARCAAAGENLPTTRADVKPRRDKPS
jgi:hypothetical protein